MRLGERKVADLAGYLKQVLKDTANLSSPIWFRGQGKIEWNLLPSLYRQNEKRTEQHYLNSFKQNATILMKNQPTEEFEWLFHMQHYGIPTRLLDWTESPLAALYFAVESELKRDAVVWALLPTEMNKLANVDFKNDPNRLPIITINDDTLGSYLPETLKGEGHTRLNPIAGVATRINQRMQAQLSVFTIHHREKTNIEELSPGNKHIWRYKIPKERKENIRRDLERIKVGEFQLFPEMSSIKSLIVKE